ncbi:MAG TPA: transcription elongation factor GreA [bacterium]|nr:transcription elongation factor GreA [bacterium]
MADFLVSRATRDKLQEELNRLKVVRRPQVAKALEEARAHGDLKENAEYDAAKQEQGLLEARIRELEDKLGRVRILEDENITGEHVSIGCKVTVKDLKTKGEELYRIVGEEEANFAENKISLRTPIARGMIGKKVGDKVDIQVPAGLLQYQILKIEVATD